LARVAQVEPWFPPVHRIEMPWVSRTDVPLGARSFVL